MTLRQSVLKVLYRALMKAGKVFGVKAGILRNKENTSSLSDFYDLTATANNGAEISFKDFKGKNVLIVNTASGCGYTSQLNDLEKLHDTYKNQLAVIGFPSNDFKEQEKLSDSEIASFCKVNFNVSFLLAQKSIVIKTEKQNTVYEWLSNRQKNGWNDKAPEWNFSKYLVNKSGVLSAYFGPGVEPLSIDITGNL